MGLWQHWAPSFCVRGTWPASQKGNEVFRARTREGCVTQVGLDVNVVAHLAWQAAPLQFVAGLGPRKAQLLARAVQREEFVQSRSELYKGLGVLGKHVFRQASPGLLQIVFRLSPAHLQIAVPWAPCGAA